MQTPPDLASGLAARVQLTVTDADTAQALGSGDVPVLATPRLLALAEAATVAATARQLAPGTTTVGVRAQIEHCAPTPIGRTVTAEARLTKVNGRRLTFEVTVDESGRRVADAVVERVMVERQRFMERVFADD